jgi:RNA polymerase sigma-70 factor (ECF subfamily)
MINAESLKTSPVSDYEIINRILQGEKELYAIIVRRYNQRLYRVAMSIVYDDSETEDIMQVAYIKAYENLSKFEFKSSFSTWLTRILINESLLRVKKRGKSINFNDDLMEKEINNRKGTEQTPASKLLNTELGAILQESIGRLPEKYRTVFILREIEEMNVAETTLCLDISEANVKVRLNRAKAMLKESLSGYYKKDDIFHFHLLRCDRIVEAVMLAIRFT